MRDFDGSLGSDLLGNACVCMPADDDDDDECGGELMVMLSARTGDAVGDDATCATSSLTAPSRSPCVAGGAAFTDGARYRGSGGGADDGSGGASSSSSSSSFSSCMRGC